MYSFIANDHDNFVFLLKEIHKHWPEEKKKRSEICPAFHAFQTLVNSGLVGRFIMEVEE